MPSAECRAPKLLRGQLQIGIVVSGELLIGPERRVQEMLDPDVVLAGDVVQGTEQRRHLGGRAAQQVDQLFPREPKPLEREVP